METKLSKIYAEELLRICTFTLSECTSSNQYY
ncbi:hypothetical protein MUK42_36114 [Musa troglodytarum]|uniref:Uncharacterized protein n=1 Tax=Musa troglodytarum TaxID=320322 RepID=A0A9E7GEU1_9LILI|nr:hypothetical protein MUK42_36114 [Musa troglodytarum]